MNGNVKREFCPLDLLIGMSAPLRFDLDIGNVRISMLVKPLRMRTVLALWGLQWFTGLPTPRVDTSSVIMAALRDCIVKLWVNDEEVKDIAQVNPIVLAALFNFCLQINGIIEPGAARLQEELDKIAETVKEQMRNSADGAPEPQDVVDVSPYLHLAQIAYSALSTGGKFTADYWIDEPYLLLLAAMAVARGEKEYFRERSAEVEQRAQASQPQVLGLDVQLLLNKVPQQPAGVTTTVPTPPPVLPKPPIARIRKGEDIVEQMERLAEQIAGIKLQKRK